MKIDVLPSYLYKTRFLRRSPPVYLSSTVDNSGPLCIKLIGSRDEPAYRKYIMQILRKHVTRWRVKFRPQPSGSPFCALFVRSTNFSCENAGAHIKHVVIPLNLASGINRRYSHGWPSSATGIKIKFFNKMKLLPHRCRTFSFSRLFCTDESTNCAVPQKREREEEWKSFGKVCDPVAK